MSKPKPRIILVNGKYQLAEDRRSDIDELAHRVQGCCDEVWSIIRPILKAGGAAKPEDMAAMRHMVLKTMIEKIHSLLNRDEMHIMLCILLSERIMSDIEANRWGGDKPDLLSGQ